MVKCTDMKKRLLIKFHRMDTSIPNREMDIQSKRERTNMETDILLRRECTKVMRTISNHFLVTGIESVQKIGINHLET